MKPTLSKRLNMTVGEDIVGKVKVKVNGDYQNGGDGNCNNDCSNLTLKLKSGANTLFEGEYAPPLDQDHEISFTYTITEDDALWDKSSANPSLHVYMKLKGSEGPGIIRELQMANHLLNSHFIYPEITRRRLSFQSTNHHGMNLSSPMKCQCQSKPLDSHWLQVRLPWVWQQFGPDQGLKIIQMIDCEIV